MWGGMFVFFQQSFGLYMYGTGCFDYVTRVCSRYVETSADYQIWFYKCSYPVMPQNAQTSERRDNSTTSPHGSATSSVCHREAASSALAQCIIQQPGAPTYLCCDTNHGNSWFTMTGTHTVHVPLIPWVLMHSHHNCNFLPTQNTNTGLCCSPVYMNSVLSLPRLLNRFLLQLLVDKYKQRGVGHWKLETVY